MNEKLATIGSRIGFNEYPQKREGFETFIAGDDGQPVYLLTLARLAAQPQYAAAWKGPKGDTVQQAQELFESTAAAAMRAQGAYSISGAKQPVANAISHAGREFEEWDCFYVDYYPSRTAVLDVWASSDWAEVLVHRTAAFDDVVVMPSTAGELNRNVNSYAHASPPMDIAEIDGLLQAARAAYVQNHMDSFTMENRLARARHFAESDDGKPINMLNLIIEKDEVCYPEGYTGEKGTTLTEAKQLYAKYAGAINAQNGAMPIIGVSHVMPALDWRGSQPEGWKQFYFVYYPQRRNYLQLLAAPAYVDALPHKLAGDEATLLIPMKHGLFNMG